MLCGQGRDPRSRTSGHCWCWYATIQVRITIRLIISADTGAQPLINEDETLILCVNGEIYNHLALRKGLEGKPKFKTHSDCEVIHHLVSVSPHAGTILTHPAQYRKHDKDLCNLLDGMFSFVLLDESTTPSRIIAARDPIGITTLYQGWNTQKPDLVYFASELKALIDECDRIISFPPGHVYDSRTNATERYFNPTWWNTDADDLKSIPTNHADLKQIREALEEAVRKRLMSEVPYGVLLSGGLDSSLIAAIAARETEKVAQALQEQRKKRLESSGSSTPNYDMFADNSKLAIVDARCS